MLNPLKMIVSEHRRISELDQSGVSDELRVNSEPQVNLTLTLKLRNPQRRNSSRTQISEIPSVE